MTTTDINGIVFLEATDPISPFHTLMNLLQSGTSNALNATARIFPVVDTTEQDALETTYSPSPTNPIYSDLGGVLYRSQGSGWSRVVGAPLPYLRLRSTAALSRAAGAWAQATNLTTAITAGAQPWTYSGGQVTLTEGGLFDLDATISMTASGFSVRIIDAVTFAVLAQSGYSTTTSQTNGAHAKVRLAAGASFIVQVYPGTTASITADANAASATGAGTPTHLTVTKLSD